MKDEFWDIACGHMPQFRPLLSVLFSLLVLTIWALGQVEPGTGASIIAKVDLVLIVAALAVGVFFKIRCQKHRRQRGEWNKTNEETEQSTANDQS